MKLHFYDFIEYDDEDWQEENWHRTIKGVKENIKTYFPNVKKVSTFHDNDGPGITVECDDLDTMKHIWIRLSFSNGEQQYQELVANGWLEDELKCTSFYDCLDQE